MRILWLSNAALSDDDVGASGTWLDAMAGRLAAAGEVALGNVTSGTVGCATRQDCGSISQWIVPSSVPAKRDGLPSREVVAAIRKVVDEFAPDLIHVWGTESYWGLLTGRHLLAPPALLETQGLKFAIARVVAGGLSFREQLACIGLKEILRSTTLFQVRKSFEQWGAREKEIIENHREITVQTSWLEAQVRQYSGAARISRNDFVLRAPFYVAQPWRSSGSPSLFCSAAYPAASKGLHVAIRAAARLKRRFPEIVLRIAGAHNRTGLQRDGYTAWVNREAHRLGVHDNLTWLGPLSAMQIIGELQRCSVFLMPSLAEGYCLGLAEAMQLGVPSVVSFAGGAACLAKDGDSALFFPMGDDAMCAWQVERLLMDSGLAERMSANARAVALERNDPDTIIARQLALYRRIIAAGWNG